jgi:wyosine [tRNA(Phe)-imidazoG37] synthetase (radical SAM superfamily)
MSETRTRPPFLLYSDGNGNVFEDKTLFAAGRSGWYFEVVPDADWIKLPEGGTLYELPDRRAVGFDVHTGELRTCEKGWAVAAFVPPAHTVLYLASFEKMPNAETLPLFNYGAVGWYKGEFFTPAVRIEADIRQESVGFDKKTIESGVAAMRKAYPQNRLVEHLASNCALRYECPAARNYFMGRWECPVPASPACNSNCLGCISFQPVEDGLTSPQDRLSFKPTAAEIVEFTVPHLETAAFPLISFGQGCEGEPLLMWQTLREAIIEIRKFTQKGSININTNGSKPDAVDALCQVGLNSIRVSINSARREIYTNYYLPNNYDWDDVVESLRVMRRHGGWSSINYFVFPGMTDAPEEIAALKWLIQETGLNMIQWRNFNIDPDWYLGKLNVPDTPETKGIKAMMADLRETFPDLKFGYFNPPMERIEGNYAVDFAH